jgi:diguanylate cyclase (GGDEF)-like protein/PAS domain S-box-containing protein
MSERISSGSEKITLQPLPGRPDVRFLDQQSVAMLERQERQVLATEQAITAELVVTLPDGSDRSYLVTDYPVCDSQGQVVGIGSVSLDISERKRADGMFRELLEAQAEAIVIVNSEGEIVIVNAQAEKMFGYTRGELLGQRVEMLLPRHVRDQHVKARDGYSASPHTRPMGTGFDLSARREDGTEFPVEVSLSTLATPDGALITSRISDISSRTQAEAALREAEERFRLAFEYAPIGMALVALDGSFLRVNRALCTITGYPPEMLLTSTIHDLTHPDDRETGCDKLQELIAGRIDSFRTERRHVNAAGRTSWATVSMSVVRDSHGGAIHFIAQLEDISERKLLEDRLRRLADYDSLTGVRNRRQFEQDLSLQIGSCQRYGEEAAMLMIDLDGFKAINDTHGHRAGDDMLKAVASAIRIRLRSTDTVARLGGDEFAVLLPHVSPSKARAVTVDLRRCIAAVRITVSGATLGSSASIGVAHINRDTRSKEAIVNEADHAMYADKRAARH